MHGNMKIETDTKTEKTIYLGFVIVAIFQYRNNFSNDGYIAFFRAYLATILKALDKLNWVCHQIFPIRI